MGIFKKIKKEIDNQKLSPSERTELIEIEEVKKATTSIPDTEKDDQVYFNVLWHTTFKASDNDNCWKNKGVEEALVELFTKFFKNVYGIEKSYIEEVVKKPIFYILVSKLGLNEYGYSEGCLDETSRGEIFNNRAKENLKNRKSNKGMLERIGTDGFIGCNPYISYIKNYVKLVKKPINPIAFEFLIRLVFRMAHDETGLSLLDDYNPNDALITYFELNADGFAKTKNIIFSSAFSELFNPSNYSDKEEMYNYVYNMLSLFTGIHYAEGNEDSKDKITIKGKNYSIKKDFNDLETEKDEFEFRNLLFFENGKWNGKLRDYDSIIEDVKSLR